MARVRLHALDANQRDALIFGAVGNNMHAREWFNDNAREVYRELERRKAARAHSAGMEGDAT
jgi:hypothetical protein